MVPYSGRREECGNARAAGANALGESSLRNEVQIDLAVEHHFFQQFVFADVGADVLRDLSGGEQQAHAEAVDAGVVADGGEIFRAFADQRANQVFRDAAQSEPAHHDGGAVEDVSDGFVGIGYDFVHGIRIVTKVKTVELFSVRSSRSDRLATDCRGQLSVLVILRASALRGEFSCSQLFPQLMGALEFHAPVPGSPDSRE